MKISETWRRNGVLSAAIIWRQPQRNMKMKRKIAGSVAAAICGEKKA